MQNHTSHQIIEGGDTRQASLKNALTRVKTPYVMVTDVARSCISETLLQRLITEKENADCIVPFLPVIDTAVYQNETINRDELRRIQTPQLSKTSILSKALDTQTDFTDDSSAIAKINGTIKYVLGSNDALKLTTIDDIQNMPCFKKPSSDLFVGSGFDVHAFEDKKPMFLGGVHLDKLDYGFKAHSDGDVAIHALIDSMLGAMGMDDIGTLFPDTDNQYKGIDSKELLKITYDKLLRYGFEINHIDLTIMAEQPKIAPHKKAIRFTLAKLLNIEPIHLNVKATTTEKLGFIGRKEGVAVSATTTLKYFDWTTE